MFDRNYKITEYFSEAKVCKTCGKLKSVRDFSKVHAKNEVTYLRFDCKQCISHARAKKHKVNKITNKIVDGKVVKIEEMDSED